eukprot:TRINITY_DN42620_c0_g1_i1.p1 TRINITY_DN42620_c0_g1~~TRINITY_DN42620_c0_g1_i1.p1  ORF type:complete len:259 (+),score=33.89 TRINITY_DN42620_c0_g1_i1:38-814(+)
MPGRLVFMNGHPTAGKTWMADYLAKHHGFRHIDGDEELHLYKSDKDEGDIALKSIVAGFQEYFVNYVIDGKGAGPDVNWQPFHERVVQRVQALRKTSPKADIVVGLAIYPRAVRDFIRSRLDEPSEFVALTVSVAEYASAAAARILKFQEAQNLSGEEVWKMFVTPKHPDLPYPGEDGWIKHYTEHPSSLVGFEESDDHVAVIPTEKREQVPRNVELALNLVPYSGPIDAEAISQVNYDRFKSYAEERQRRHELRCSA